MELQDVGDQAEVIRLNEIRQRVRDQGIEPHRRAKTQTDKAFILNCLKNHFIFYNLSEKELDNVKENMFWAEMAQGNEVFRQGSLGTCFYIIEKGSVQIRVDNQVTKQLRANQGFGQLALLYDIERPSTAMAIERCSFWIIDKVSFREAVEQIVIGEFESNQKFLQGMAFYQFLRPQQKEKVASSFVTLKYYKGQTIIEEGDPGSSFYIIKEGTAALLQGNLEERKIYKGESFGQNSLYYNTMRKMTVRAQEDVVCQVLGRQTLAKIIGPDFREVMFRNYVKHVLQRNRLLFGLLKRDEEGFFEGMRVQYKKANQVVFKKGTSVQRLVIIIEGKLKKFRSAHYLAEAGQTWGETFLNEANVRLEDDIVVETESVIIELNLMSIRQVKANNLSVLQSSVHKKEIEPINPNEFIILSELDKGSESQLMLLEYNKKVLFGKMYIRREMEQSGLENVVRQEIEAWETVDNPFLPQLRQVIHHPKAEIIITDHVTGQSLYDAIRQIGLLSTLDTQFYGACMILLLEYLMTQQIVVRDLKPDNFIVDEKGYPRLISLGSAKVIGFTHRTNTVIGTPHYMAPQMVLGKDYNQLVDLWSVGVMLYEFMVGELPFGGNTENPYEIYESIIQGDVQFPRSFTDRRAKKIIQSMLNLNPEARYNGSYSNLKSNPWFENLNWDEILLRKMQAPYIPGKIREIRPMQDQTRLGAYLERL